MVELLVLLLVNLVLLHNTIAYNNNNNAFTIEGMVLFSNVTLNLSLELLQVPCEFSDTIQHH